MAPKTLRVLPVGTALVQDFDALEGGVKRFIGRQLKEVADAPSGWGYVPTGEATEVPFRAEYLHALRDGDLEPADAETAAVAGLPWKVPAPAPKAPKDS